MHQSTIPSTAKNESFSLKIISHKHLRMDLQRCQAYIQKGTQCKTKHKANSQYCGLHETKREETGPHQFAREQLAIKHKFEVKTQIEEFSNRRTAAGSVQEIHAITNEQTIAEAHMTVRHRNEYHALREAQEAEIVANGGINPDEPARLHREVQRLDTQATFAINRLRVNRGNMGVRNHWVQVLTQYAEHVFQLINNNPGTQILDRLGAIGIRINDARNAIEAQRLQAIEWGEGIEDRIVNGIIVPPEMRLGARAMARQNPLAILANDIQNVHTQLILEQTKKNVIEILKIPVPEIYKWQAARLSMTYKAIIMFCNLSPKAVSQFSGMYCSDATIYDLEPGIFGKVVDGVWQFIYKSPNKTDLKKILAAELRDNIGMCAQGNLSRICNVLQGYMEGIGQKESVATILGREFPKLMEIDNETERLHQGIEILKANNVPDDQWTHWLDPLKE